jgi:hypothetical protein
VGLANILSFSSSSRSRSKIRNSLLNYQCIILYMNSIICTHIDSHSIHGMPFFPHFFPFLSAGVVFSPLASPVDVFMSVGRILGEDIVGAVGQGQGQGQGSSVPVFTAEAAAVVDVLALIRLDEYYTTTTTATNTAAGGRRGVASVRLRHWARRCGLESALDTDIDTIDMDTLDVDMDIDRGKNRGIETEGKCADSSCEYHNTTTSSSSSRSSSNSNRPPSAHTERLVRSEAWRAEVEFVWQTMNCQFIRQMLVVGRSY